MKNIFFAVLFTIGMIFFADNKVLAQDCQNWITVANIGGIIKYEPAVMAVDGGKLLIVATGADDALWANEFDIATSQNEWYPLGGVLTSGVNLSQIENNKIKALAIGGDNVVWTRSWQSSKNWTDWQRISQTELGVLGPVQATIGDIGFRVVKKADNSVKIDKCEPVLNCNQNGTDSTGKCKIECGASKRCADYGLKPMDVLPVCDAGGFSWFADYCDSKCLAKDRRGGLNECVNSDASKCNADIDCNYIFPGRCAKSLLKKCNSSCGAVASCGDSICNCGEMPNTCPADCYSICSPGMVNGCYLCNPTGTAWWVDDSKCAKGQKCQSGVCVSDSRSVWFCPPPMSLAGSDFYHLFSQESSWADSRKYVNVFEIYQSEMQNNSQFDSQIETINSKLNEWGIKLALEGGGITAGACDGRAVAAAVLKDIDRIVSNGGTINYIALNEPYMGGVYMGAGEADHEELEPCNLSLDQAIDQVALQINIIHQKYPNIIIGDIEPYPYFSKDELMQWIAKFRERAGYELPFFHVDAVSAFQGETAYTDMKELKDFCRKRGVDFGVIFIGADAKSDQDYYYKVMNEGDAINKSIGMSDDVLLQSWVAWPKYNLPDNANFSYTQLLRDFVTTYVATNLGHSCGTCDNGKTCNSSGRCVVSGGDGGGGTIIEIKKEETTPVAKLTRAQILQKIAQIKQLLIKLIAQLIVELQKQAVAMQK